MTSCGTEKPCCLPLKKPLVTRVIHLLALSIHEYIFYESASLQIVHVYIMFCAGFMCGTTVLDKDGVSQEVIDKEIEIGKELARKEGKPEEMLERISQGKFQEKFNDKSNISGSSKNEPLGKRI